MNHKLISQRRHVDKVYIAKLQEPAQESYQRRFKAGIVLDNECRCMPVELKILSKDGKSVQVTIQEGKFHQVKRMFEALDNKVVDLERIKFGPLDIPSDLKLDQL